MPEHRSQYQVRKNANIQNSNPWRSAMGCYCKHFLEIAHVITKSTTYTCICLVVSGYNKAQLNLTFSQYHSVMYLIFIFGKRTFLTNLWCWPLLVTQTTTRASLAESSFRGMFSKSQFDRVEYLERNKTNKSHQLIGTWGYGSINWVTICSACHRFDARPLPEPMMSYC